MIYHSLKRWLGLGFVVLISVSCSDAAQQIADEHKGNSAPRTTIVPNQSFISETRQISFDCHDADPNDYCKATYFSYIDTPISDPSDQYLGSFTFENYTPKPANLATVTVRYYSVDSLGNQEAEQQTTFTFDVDAPKPQNISVQPSPGNYTESQWIHFKCIDEVLDVNSNTAGSGCHLIYYALTDIGAAAPALENFKALAYPDALLQINRDSSLHYFAEDFAGNKSVQQTVNYTFSANVTNISNLNAVSGSAHVALSWQLPNPIGNIEGVKVIRNDTHYPQNANDGVELASTLSDHYDDNNLENGKTYYYGVYAYVTTPSSLYSIGESIAATPTILQPPGDVSDFTVIPGNGQNQLSWVLPLNRDNFSHVEIRRDIGTAPITSNEGAGIFSSVNDPTQLSYVDKPLTNSIVYYYRIFVVDNNGNYSAGIAKSAMTINAKPGTISNFKAVAGDGYVDLNWGNPNDTDLAAIYIRRQQGSAPATVSDGVAVTDCSTATTTTTCRDNSVQNGNTYYYVGFTQDSAGQYSELSISAAVSPKDMTPPAAISALNVNVGDATVLLSWQNPADGDFAGCKIIRSTQAYITDATVIGPTDGDSSIVVTTLSKDANSYSDNANNGLQNATTYYYSIFAVDSAGNYSNSAANIMATPIGDNTPPTIVSIFPVADATGVSPLQAVSAEFSEAVAANSLNGNFTLSSMGGELLGTPSISLSNSKIAEFMPDSGRLPLLTQISVSLSTGITDLSGNPLDTAQASVNTPYTWNFFTADGSWDAAFTTISDIRPWANTSAVAFDGKGHGLAVWARNTGSATTPGDNEIVARHYLPESGWENGEEFVNCYTVDSSVTPPGCLALRSGINPQLAVDAAGNAIVVWESSGHVYANRYMAGSGWGLPINLNALGNSINTLYPPKLVMDPQGMVTVAWSEYSQASSTSMANIWATRISLLAASSAWNDQLSVPELIEWDDESDALDVHLSVDDKGDVLALWYIRSDAASNIRNALYNYFHAQANGSMGWDQPSALPSTTQANTHPHSMISSNTVANAFYNISLATQSSSGNAVALWCHPLDGSTTSVLWAATFNAASAAWQVAEAISDPAAGAATPRCASSEDYVQLKMGDDGRAIALWITTGFSAQVNRFMPASQLWQGALTLSSLDARAARISIDPHGHALAMLTLLNGEVHAHRIAHDITWDGASFNQTGIRQIIAYPSTSSAAKYPNLSVDRQGNALAIWTHDVQTPGPVSTTLHDYTVRASYFGYKP